MKLKKLLPILMAVVIAFSTVFAIPQKKAEAAVWGGAVPGGIVVGTGVYVGAALMVAAGAGAIGYDEYGDEINAHAMRAWDNGTDLAKASLTATIEGAKGLGNGIVNLSSDYINFMETQLSSLSNAATTMAIDKIDNGEYSISLKYASRWYLYSVASGAAYATPAGTYTNVVVDAGNRDQPHVTFLNPVGKTATSGDSSYVAVQHAWGSDASHQLAAAMQAMPKTIEGMRAFLSSVGVSTATVQTQQWEYNQGLTEGRMREAWQDMRDAGLVIPVDSAVPYSNDGQPLRYNPDADVYTGIDGGVFNPSDVSWKMPGIKWREQSDAIEVPGVYVDTPVLTGNPTYDKETDIPNTTTNITTGTTVANPDIATSEPIEGGGTGEPPPPGSDWTRPPTKKPPNISGLIVTKFPFSLPWDFFGILGWLEAEPKAPVFKVDSSMPNPFGKDMQFDFELKLNFLDDYIGYFRSFILIGFSLFLILATRRLLGGAS